MKGKYNIDDDVWFLNIERLPVQDSETFKPDIEIFIRSILYRSLISSGKIKGIIFRENQVFYELFGTKALRIINEEYVFHSPKELKAYLENTLDNIFSYMKEIINTT